MNPRSLGFGAQDIPVIGYAALMALLIGVHVSEIPDGRDFVARHLLVGLGYAGVIRLVNRLKAPDVIVASVRTSAMVIALAMLFVEHARILPFVAGVVSGGECRAGADWMAQDGISRSTEALSAIGSTVALGLHAVGWLLPVTATIALIPGRENARALQAMHLGVSLAAVASCGLMLLVPSWGVLEASAGTPSLAEVVPVAQAACGPAAVVLLRRPRPEVFWICMPVAVVVLVSCGWFHGTVTAIAGTVISSGAAGIAIHFRNRISDALPRECGKENI